MIDTLYRSILKAFSWRFLGLFILGWITYFVTDSLTDVTVIAITYHLAMIFLYFIHERIWSRLPWGKSTGLFIQMTGMSGAGKSTLAQAVAHRLRTRGIQVEVLDGDEYREGLCKDLGFSQEDRNQNIQRLGFVSKVLARNKVISIIAAINPYENVRQELNSLHDNVRTVYIKCELKVLRRRDPKGLYYRAFLPKGDPDRIDNFTGVSDPYEPPLSPDLIIDTEIETLEQSIHKLEKFVLRNIT
jgi:adenylylsulfate kinase|tara:strand:- start:424 stop:1155 length:732 start_codon:yes stop_codon:yes gene_type:complete